MTLRIAFFAALAAFPVLGQTISPAAELKAQIAILKMTIQQMEAKIAELERYHVSAPKVTPPLPALTTSLTADEAMESAPPPPSLLVPRTLSPGTAGVTSSGQTLHVGPRGGIYHISPSGKKVYHKRK